MGYRNYFIKVPKILRDECRGLTEEQVKAKFNMDYVDFEELPGVKRLHELGKYCEHDFSKYEHFFDFNEGPYGDHEYRVVDKAFLISIIEHYHEVVSKGYLDDFNLMSEVMNHIKNASKEPIGAIKPKTIDELVDKSRLEKFMYGLRRKVSEWKPELGSKIYMLDEVSNDGQITNSWMYEYALFNLVYTYRTFDWENDLLIYAGW